MDQNLTIQLLMSWLMEALLVTHFLSKVQVCWLTNGCVLADVDIATHTAMNKSLYTFARVASCRHQR